MKTNKWLYGFRIYVHYGQGWEYEIFETSLTEARARVKEYRVNCPEYPVKMSRGRESNPDYTPKDPA